VSATRTCILDERSLPPSRQGSEPLGASRAEPSGERTARKPRARPHALMRPDLKRFRGQDCAHMTEHRRHHRRRRLHFGSRTRELVGCLPGHDPADSLRRIVMTNTSYKVHKDLWLAAALYRERVINDWEGTSRSSRNTSISSCSEIKPPVNSANRFSTR